MRKKVFSVGSLQTDGDWLEMDYVDNIEDSDIVLFNGYLDIHPASYDVNRAILGAYSNAKIKTDIYHVELYKQAVAANKIIIGCNKGMHLMASQIGARIVDHMQHPMKHRITLYDESKTNVLSYHHQMVDLSNLNPVNYQIIGYAKGLSPCYLNQFNTGYVSHLRDKHQFIIEPEILYFPSVRGLGFQFNPNDYPEESDILNICRGLVKRLIDYSLYNIVNLKIPVSLAIEDSFKFNKDHLTTKLVN